MLQPEVLVQAGGVMFLDDEGGTTVVRTEQRRHGVTVSEQPLHDLPVAELADVRVDLLPVPRCRDRGLRPAAQGIRRAGALHAVILTPVDEYLPLSLLPGHRRSHQVGMLLRDLVGDGMDQVPDHGRSVVTGQPRVDVDTAAPGGHRD